jgi:hypothetical protein
MVETSKLTKQGKYETARKKKMFQLNILFLFFIIIHQSFAQLTIQNLSCIQSTFTFSSQPTMNYNSYIGNAIYLDSAGHQQWTWIMFNTSIIPVTAQIETANLFLNNCSGCSIPEDTFLIDLFLCQMRWNGKKFYFKPKKK